MSTETELMDNVDSDTQKGRFLTFLIDKETFGIEIRYVTEIIGIQPITEMPEMPEYIKGIINLRGRIVPVMDVRLRFRKPARIYDDRTCVIVVDFNNISIGLVVDSVSEVLTIPDEDISPRPTVNGADYRGYVNFIGKKDNNVMLLVNCEKLISSEEFGELTDALQ